MRKALLVLAILARASYARRKLKWTLPGEIASDPSVVESSDAAFSRVLLALKPALSHHGSTSNSFRSTESPVAFDAPHRSRYAKLAMAETAEDDQAGAVRGARILGFGSGAYAGREAWDYLLQSGAVEPVPISKLPARLESQGIKLPDASGLKSLDTRNLKMPDLSTWTLPDTSNLKAPDLSNLNLKMPDLKVPDLSNLDIPKVSVPEMSSMKMPDLNGIKMPDMSAVEMPDMSGLKELDIKPPDLSGIRMPEIPDASGVLEVATPNPDVAEPISFNLPSLNLGPQPAFADDELDLSPITSFKAPDIESLTLPNLEDIKLPDIDLSVFAPVFQSAQDQLSSVLGPAADEIVSTLGDASGELWLPLFCGVLGASIFGAIAERQDVLGFLLRLLGGLTDVTIKTTSSVVFGAIVGFFAGALIGPITLVEAIGDLASRSSKEKLDSVVQFPGKVASSMTDSGRDPAASSDENRLR